MSKIRLLHAALVLPLASSTALAEPPRPTPGAACPQAVRATVARAFPRSSITACKAEREHGRDQIEVKLMKADGAGVTVDVEPDGKLIQIEESIAVDKVPDAVVRAFAARYPKSKIDAAEKQSPAAGPVRYELGFATEHGRKEATFTESGAFEDEE